MRKSYSFKKLGRQVQRLAAIMLVTLMAVGNVFAEYDGTGLFTKINSTDELTTGYYVVTDANGEFAMFNTGTSFLDKTDAVFFNPSASIVWYVDVDADGNVTLYNEEIGKYVEYHGNNNNAYLVETVSDNCRWTPTVEENGFVLTNIAFPERMLRYNPSSPRFACYKSSSTNVRKIAFYKQGPAPAVMAPTFNIPSATYYTPQTVELTCSTPGANVYYTINDGEAVLYNAPFTVSTTSTVSTYAVFDEDTSLTNTITINFPVQLANIAAFYAAENDAYTITSDMTFVYRNGRYMYVKDETGGLLVYDYTNPVITTEYNEGDVFTGGITGTRSPYAGLVEIVPVLNTAEGTPGAAVAPIEVTVAQLLANPDDYMSQLVILRNGTFNGGVLNNNNNPKIFSQDGNDLVIYNRFNNLTNAMMPEGQTATVVGFVSIHNETIQLFPRNANDIALTDFPFTSNFDGAGAYTWTLVNGDNTNKWYAGKAQGFDNGKLYISSSNGATNKYNVSTASVSHAYIPVTLPASDVLLTFDLRTVGDANDFLQVALMDELPEAGTLPTNYLARYNGVSEFTTETVLIPAENAGEKYLVFTWNNDDNGGTQTPAAIDNVTLNSTCTQISNIAVLVNEHTAAISWTAPEGQESWTVEYKDVNDDSWQSVLAATTSVTLNNLATDRNYDVRVRANCGPNDNSAWVNAQFNVPCLQLATEDMDITIGTGTSTSNIAPANAYYKNSWTQMVYPASEFGTPGYINSVSWYVNSALTHNYDYFKIYMGTKADAINNSTTDWVSLDDLTLVYESYNGSLGTAAGWETYTLATPYYYNGEDNLVIVTARTAQAYNSVQYRYTSVTNTVLYRRSDSSPDDYGNFPGTAAGTRAANLPNLKVDFTAYVCGDDVCAVPTGLNYGNVTTNSATITWEAGDATAWKVNYKSADEENWHHVDVTVPFYNMTNLDQNADYTVTVMANCGAIGMSEEATTSFTTVAECQVPTDLAVNHHVANSIVTWVGIPGVNSYEVQYAESGAADWNTSVVTGATTFILGNLVEGTSYKVRVRSVCGADLTSDWTNTLTFTRPVYCAIPTSITAATVTNNQVTLTWDAGFGDSWVVEYGEDGFTLGEGTQVTTTNSTVTITGLDADTDYDVYVKANCGEYTGNWSSAYSFKTECDPITVTESMPWFEDFESYTGSGEKPFHCWLTPVKTSNGGPFVYCGYDVSCHSGANSAELKGYDNVLVLPAFTNDIHTLSLSFWATAVTPTDGTLEVGVLTDVNDMNSFEFVAYATNPSTRNGVGNYMGPFSFENVTANGGRIALRYHSNYGTSNSWNLDDFTVFIPQDCPAPVGITANVNAETSEAEITWTPFGEETVWQVQYGEAGFVLGTGTIATVNDANYTMTDLAEGASYDVYVRAMCSATESSVWAGPYTFEAPGACTQFCTYTINLVDSWGDGWNGGTITVSQNGEQIGSYTISSGSSATYTVDLCSGVDALFTYTAASYPGENSWTVVDANNETVWSGTGSGMSSGNTLDEIVTPNCGGCTSTCEYTINLTDSWGDGWNGGTITVSQNDEELGTFTIASGSSASYTVELCDGMDVVFTYTAASYPGENSWVVLDANGEQVWTGTGTGMTSGSTLTETVTVSCGSEPGPGPEPCANACEYVFVLTDSYGDGWGGSWGGSNAGSLDIEQNGNLVQTLTLPDGSSETYYVSLCNGEEVTLTLHPDYYADEMGVTVYDAAGTVIWELDASGFINYGDDDDVIFTFTPACVACDAPTALVVDAVTSTSATLSWTGVDTMDYNVYYRNMADNDWTVVDVTGTTVTLTLAANTTYVGKVKAGCDIFGNFSNEVVFFTTAAAIGCDDYTVSEESGSGYYTPVNDYYNNSHTEQIYTPEEVGAAGNITKLSFNYQGSSTMTKKTNVKIYLGHTTKDEFSSTSDWITDGLTLVYTGDLNCATGWNEFTLDEEFAYNGNDNLVVRVVDESGQYGSSSNKFYYTNCTGYKCMTWQNDSYTWDNATSKTGTRRTYRPDITFNVCSAGTDIALTAIHNIPNGCDLSNLPVSIDMQVTGETSVSAIEAYYRINDGNAVHETITLDEPLNHGEVMSYTFNTLATFPLDVNTVSVWIEIVNDGNVANNMLTSGPIENIDPASIPFIETFNAGEINDGWFIRDVNGDGVTFAIANGVATYGYNDEMAADDWLMTTCMNLYKSYYSWSPYVYEVSYTYKANDPTMVEQFGVYYGMKEGDEYVMNNELGTHVFNNAGYVTVHKYFTVPQSGTYYFGIHATSGAGNAGFKIDNFSVKEAVTYTVYADANGSVEPEGENYVAEGDEVTLTITPDFGYHLNYIFNYYSGEFLRGENTDNATVEYFTFTPEDGDNLIVSFTPNKYEVNAMISNLAATGYNDDALGATYTPMHQVVAHGGSHTGIITLAEHYHIVSLKVNGMDMTSNLTTLSDNQYQLTINDIYENKNIDLLVDLDSTTIVYTVLAGQGTINDAFVVDATTELPAIYTVTLPGYSNLLSTIVPAPGYHVASIIVDGVEHNNIESYSFEHLFGTHTVVVTFAVNHYVITTAGYGNGTVSEGAEFDYDPDFIYVFTATPADGYRIGTLTRNNEALTVANPAETYTETLTNITSDYNYEVFFVQNTYTITATCGANGTISPAGASSYFYHQNAEYVITANAGYYIASVTYDGTTYNFTQEDGLTTFTVPFFNIEEDHAISATFAAMSFEITVNAGAHGTITPATASYAYGATPTFTITPEAGYSIADVTVDGTSIGAVSTYTFPALTADHSIAATFAANVYTITATAGNGGTISPAGASTVAYNGDKTYTISANSGYHVSDVFVDGVSVGAVTSYSFTGVTANHTIYAAFAANEYTVTVTQPNHGTITPGTTTVLYGATPSFVITPAIGYNVASIAVNGSNVNLNNVPNVNGTYTYTFAAINSNQTITATMTAKTYTIAASAGSNGTISPSGNTTVNHGGSQAYTFTPANGYVVAQVTVDGMSIGAPTSYVFTNVVANHTINVTFAAAECEAPISLYTTHIDSTSAMLHWSHPTATTFNIQYKNPTSNFTTIANVSGNSYQLTGLTPGATYLWQVQAICAGNNHSDWANMVSFQTDNTTIDETGIEDLVKNNIKVYGEHQNVHILNNEGMNIDNVRIFDAYGKLIYSGSVNTTHEVISLNVAAGTYMVNVTTDKGVANYKVVLMK